jgi:hypothetical protein
VKLLNPLAILYIRLFAFARQAARCGPPALAKRVNTRGRSQAAKCMTMPAIAYNVKKMLKFMRQWPTAALRALDHTTEPLWHLPFFMPEFRLPPAIWARI